METYVEMIVRGSGAGFAPLNANVNYEICSQKNFRYHDRVLIQYIDGETATLPNGVFWGASGLPTSQKLDSWQLGISRVNRFHPIGQSFTPSI
ncbi:unnamed protein product [Nesidiocoris tenuis]|uniref:Uncharacterized protein n=1 Tax=Nesidiocoris tenuis TaxID=355587 RepID=A0A6H5FYZ9_9HEMI|nr:unnamed protein product [Nesidiocoris tenuis]